MMIKENIYSCFNILFSSFKVVMIREETFFHSHYLLHIQTYIGNYIV